MSGEEPPQSDEFDRADAATTDASASTDGNADTSGGESNAEATSAVGDDASGSAEAGLSGEADVLDELFAVIEQRKADRPEGSYTTSLFDHEKGQNAVLEKIGEEATEVILAAKDDAADDLAAESADLVYHLLVLLSMQDLDVARLYAELESRR